MLSTLSYILTVMYFEVSDLCIALALTTYATQHCRLLMPGYMIFITHKLELQYDYIASNQLLQHASSDIHLSYQFCLKVHSMTINAIHEIDDKSCVFYQSVIHVYVYIRIIYTLCVCVCVYIFQGRWKRSGCSGFGQTSFSQGKNKILFF